MSRARDEQFHVIVYDDEMPPAVGEFVDLVFCEPEGEFEQKCCVLSTDYLARECVVVQVRAA